MKRLILIILTILSSPIIISAQNALHTNIALGNPIGGNNYPVVLPGASITVTPSNLVFSSASSTTPATQPFIADSNGNYSFYGAPCQTFSITVTAVGFPSYPYNWTAPPAGSGAMCGMLNTTEYVDGIINTTISQALSRLPGCSDNSGSYIACGQIIIPSGTYTISSEIDLGPHVWIRGSGPVNTHIIWLGTTSGTCAFSYTGFTTAGTIFNTGWGQASGGIQDLDIQGDVSTGVCGIHWTDIQGMKIQNVSVHDFTGTSAAGLWQDATNTPTGGNPGWTERSNVSAWSYNNTIDWHRTNNVAAALGQVTMGYGNFDLWLNVFSGQTAIQIENGASAGGGSFPLDSYSRFHIIINGDGAANETGIVMNNTAIIIKASGSVHMEGLTGTGSKGFNMISSAAAFGIVGNVDNVGATSNSINSSNYNVVSEEFSSGGGNDFLALGDDQACNMTLGYAVQVCEGNSNGFAPFAISKGGNVLYYFDSSSATNKAHFAQSNNADQTYTLPNATGNVVLDSATQNFTNKTLNTPLSNGTALQIFNTTTTCTTAASVGATCTTAAVTLPVAESDTSYRIVCTGKGLTAVPVVIATTNSSATQFTITISALTAVAASFTSYDCIVGHN